MDDPAFETEVDTTTQSILLHAAQHDLAALKPFLRTPGAASVQDPETGLTPLHACIDSCGPKPAEESEDDAAEIEKAVAVMKELFFSGAIWNDLSADGETPGCVAWRLGRRDLYELCVEAGVRAEMLLNLMGGYEELSSAGDEDEEDMEIVEGEEVNGQEVTGEESIEIINGTTDGKDEEQKTESGATKKDVNSADYLASNLTFTDSKLVDADSNGVMMAWETSIMERSVATLLPPPENTGKRILNIGFGMGIIDNLFAATSPSSHHIIEAHPAVLAKLHDPTSPLSQITQSPAVTVHAGRWQDICPVLLESGEVFDAIYFDTFGEDYAQLKLFFTEFVVGLLDPAGRFGFFNGLGADRRVCYDVYTRVVEMDLLDAGFECEWENVDVPALGEEKEGEWEGVRRRYWTLETYRLPVCTFLG
ncbi:arginine N-methyltransferase 2 [Coleophoma cylindrospora]|uniref:Arginine N-methyltransferase 2 n=1 Tax=Coleophoma cylindrospora TaxID=1849047 RepID=A0A3D8SGD8_9HELO|nr:arginine N-methyltransferase 2 [Coleophoma cylindrospora]